MKAAELRRQRHADQSIEGCACAATSARVLWAGGRTYGWWITLHILDRSIVHANAAYLGGGHWVAGQGMLPSSGGEGVSGFSDISLEEWEIRTRRKADHLRGEKYDVEPAGEPERFEREIACPDCGSFKIGGVSFGEQPEGLEAEQDRIMLELHRKRDHPPSSGEEKG